MESTRILRKRPARVFDRAAFERRLRRNDGRQANAWLNAYLVYAGARPGALLYDIRGREISRIFPGVHYLDRRPYPKNRRYYLCYIARQPVPAGTGRGGTEKFGRWLGYLTPMSHGRLVARKRTDRLLRTYADTDAVTRTRGPLVPLITQVYAPEEAASPDGLADLKASVDCALRAIGMTAVQQLVARSFGTT